MKRDMIAAVFEGEGRFKLKNVPIPELKKDDDVLLKILSASVCGTDVHILDVPPGHPATPGSILCHEYMGKVIKTSNSVKHLKPGDHVVVAPNITCGLCEYCQMGQPNMCRNMTTLGIFIDGGFAEYNVAPAKSLYLISKSVPPEIAVFAEPLSCVLNSTLKIKAQPGESAVVMGAGPIGLYFIMLFKASGVSKIIASEPNEFRRRFAKKCGATMVIDPSKEDLYAAVKKETQIGSDIVVDAVGSLLNDAINTVRRGGIILLFGMNSQARSKIRQYDITRQEIQIYGSYVDKNTFPPVVRILESGILPLEQLITHRYPLKDVEKGIEAMRKGKAIKVIITP